MEIEVFRTDRCYQIIIPISESYHDKYVRKFLDYLKLKENSTKSQATDADIEKLSEEVMEAWWDKNKEKFTL